MSAIPATDEKKASSDYDDRKQAPGPADETSRQIAATDAEEAAHQGVKKVEGAFKVFGKYTVWLLYLGIGLSAFIYAIDSSTTYVYLAFATSSFSKHSLLAAVQTAQGIILAVGKPVTAKFADVTSRGIAYILVLSFYVLGYIIIASSKTVGAVAGGYVLYSVGYSGLQILNQIIIADITALKWRGLVYGLVSAPFIMSAFIGPNIAEGVMAGGGWRWGYGMFAILWPATLAPLIATLFWAERKAVKLGYVTPPPKTETTARSVVTDIYEGAKALDILGLLLLGGALACLLLPMTLARSARDGWKNPSMIAMLVVGGVLLIVFFVYETFFASAPVIAPRLWKNRAVVISSIIGFFDFVSFYLTWSYLSSFVYITQDWSIKLVGYFGNTQNVALTVFAITGGLIMRLTHRYKYLMIAGLCIRLAGVGMMIHSRGANGSTAELVWTQILQGLGGGFASVTTTVAAQAGVPHVDTATATALVLLITEIGGSVGYAISGAIWTNTMPDKLAEHLPFLNSTDVAQLFGSIAFAREFPRGHPVREGTILAYAEVMHTMLIAATVISVPPLIASLFMTNFYLGDQQNAVEQIDLSGETVEEKSA